MTINVTQAPFSKIHIDVSDLLKAWHGLQSVADMSETAHARNNLHLILWSGIWNLLSLLISPAIRSTAKP